MVIWLLTVSGGGLVWVGGGEVGTAAVEWLWKSKENGYVKGKAGSSTVRGERNVEGAEGMVWGMEVGREGSLSHEEREYTVEEVVHG